jgi:succinylarginine dihydrolase
MHSGVKFTETLYAKLTDWVRRRYRNTLTLMDLPDPQLLIDSRTALDELTQILQLGSIYDFQKA